MNDAIAIDFGTMRTKVAYYDTTRNSLELMRLGRDERPFVPSLFFLGEDGRRLFGDDAAEHLDSEPLAFLSKPLKRELREQWVRAGNRVKATPTELLSILFAGLRNRTNEVACFREILPTGLFLTVPAQYGPPDRDVLARAARNAGFHEERIRFVDEPVAAAQAWLAELGGTEDYIVVLDCGGGTLDWACLHRLEGGQFELIPELPPGGDNRVGGFDIDKEIFEWTRDSIIDIETRNELDTQRCLIRDQIRVLKERHSRTGSGGKVRIGNVSFDIPGEVIENIIVRRFTTQACQNLCFYLDKVRDRLKIETPTVLLVGGSARLRGFKDAIEEQCECKAVWWERSEYATVLGALFPWSSSRKSSTAEPINPAPPKPENPKPLPSEPTTPPKPEGPKVTVNDSLAQAQYEEATNAMQRGDTDAAIQKLTLCVMLSPGLSEARELLAKAFVKKNDLQSAMIAAKAWTDASPENPRAWITLSKVAFTSGDFCTSALVLGRNLTVLDVEGLLLLAASLYRQSKIADVKGVLERIQSGETDRTVRTLGLFLLPWLKRGFDYGEEDLRNYTEALAGGRSLTATEFITMKSMLSWFDIVLPEFSLSVQVEMLIALLTLNHGNLRKSLDEFYQRCKGEIGTELVWLSRNPDFLGRMLASTLCRKGKINEATELITAMCKRNPTFNIRLVQGEKAFQDCANDPRVRVFFEPELSVSENHGAVFNDVTVTNGSAYRVTNVMVKAQVVRQGGKSDPSFTLSFAEIAPGTTQSLNGVFKNTGWFGGDVERVETRVVSCDQQFHRSKTLANEHQKGPSGFAELAPVVDDADFLVDGRSLFSKGGDIPTDQQCGVCPHGHGPMQMWEGKPRCWTCGYPDK